MNTEPIDASMVTPMDEQANGSERQQMPDVCQTVRPSRGGQPGRSGPPGNDHATRHGVFGFLSIGKLPRGASYVRRLLGQLRESLEEAVREKHGELSVYHSALIQSALRHEGRCLLLQRYLRQGDEITETQRTASVNDEQAGKGKVHSRVKVTAKHGLTLENRINLLREIGAASTSRDQCLQRLGLDQQNSRVLDLAAFYAAPSTPVAPSCDYPAPGHTQATSGANAGDATTLNPGGGDQ